MQEEKKSFLCPLAIAPAGTVGERCTAKPLRDSPRAGVPALGQERLAKPVRSSSPQTTASPTVARTENALAKVFNKPALQGQTGMLAFFSGTLNHPHKPFSEACKANAVLY